MHARTGGEEEIGASASTLDRRSSCAGACARTTPQSVSNEHAPIGPRDAFAELVDGEGDSVNGSRASHHHRQSLSSSISTTHHTPTSARRSTSSSTLKGTRAYSEEAGGTVLGDDGPDRGDHARSRSSELLVSLRNLPQSTNARLTLIILFNRTKSHCLA
jgi:hypothetical protein